MKSNELKKSKADLNSSPWFMLEGDCPHCDNFMAIVECATVKFCPYCGKVIETYALQKEYCLKEVRKAKP
jgi:C4-type Zn-finger protein